MTKDILKVGDLVRLSKRLTTDMLSGQMVLKEIVDLKEGFLGIILSVSEKGSLYDVYWFKMPDQLERYRSGGFRRSVEPGMVTKLSGE